MRDSSSAIDRRAAGELVASYDYELPTDAVAQRPPRDRESARLLVLDRASARREERVFREIGAFLRAGDALVVNDTRVVPARLAARVVGPERGDAAAFAAAADRAGSGRGGTPASLAPRVLEILLLREVAVRRWRALVKPAKHARVGARLALEPDGPRARVVASGESGERVLEFEEGSDLAAHVAAHGVPPLPPYIRRAAEPSDRDDYQTVYAREPGAIAAPTAGLHFTERLLHELRTQGVRVVPITLDVGLPTFRPLREDALADVRLGAEAYAICGDASEAIRDTRAHGGRVVAVGTTVVRALESAWDEALGAPRAGSAETTLFVRPGHRFRAVDALVTNFHWPRTSLLVLVAAFAGREAVLAAYRDALARGFRFASYGDAMLIT